MSVRGLSWNLIADRPLLGNLLSRTCGKFENVKIANDSIFNIIHSLDAFTNVFFSDDTTDSILESFEAKQFAICLSRGERWW